MTVFEYIIGAILIVFSVLIIIVVLLQEGNEGNVGVITGSSDTFMDKGKARSWDQKLARWTKVIAIMFFVLVFAGMLTTKFLGPSSSSGSSNSSTNSSSQTSSGASSGASSDASSDVSAPNSSTVSG